MRIVVTVDTEADGQWDHGRPLATENVAAWPPFQSLCESAGVAPTYLITSEIAQDATAAAYLRELVVTGAAEVGAHLHPWTTPPFEEAEGLRYNDPAHVYPCHLGPRLLRAKLEAITAQVEAAVGVRPTSYRAGRFGFDAIGARALADLGYVVDSSVTPYVSWRKNAGRPGWGGGPDFRAHGAYPFRVAGTGEPGLVELPVTILPTHPFTRHTRWLRDHWQARPLRAARRALRVRPRSQPLWLRPRPEYALADLQALVVEAERRQLPYAVFMFHSSELLAGASPYRATPADVDALLDLLEQLFAWVRGRGHGFTTLTAAGRDLAAFARLPCAEL